MSARRRLRTLLARVAAASLAACLAGSAWTAGPPVARHAAPAGEAPTPRGPARRIVSLAPHITELLFAAGAGERVVGASAFSDYPEPAKHIPRVGDSHAFDLERILALRPDLAVAWSSGNPPRHVATLERLGIPVFIESAERLDEIGDAIERLGRLAGTREVADAAARRYRERLAELRARYAGRRPVRVFHQVWDDPLMTVNARHPISDLIVACGGVNVFADAPALAPRISRESVLRAAPEVITAADDQGDPLAAWRRWPALPAVAAGRLVQLPADAISRLSPRLLDAAGPLCEAIEAARH